MNIAGKITDMIEEMKPLAATVTETLNLYTDMGFNSLEFVYLLVRIEESLMISIELTEMEQCLQVGRLISLVESKVKEAGYDQTLADRA